VVERRVASVVAHMDDESIDSLYHELVN